MAFDSDLLAVPCSLHRNKCRSTCDTRRFACLAATFCASDLHSNKADVLVMLWDGLKPR